MTSMLSKACDVYAENVGGLYAIWLGTNFRGGGGLTVLGIYRPRGTFTNFLYMEGGTWHNGQRVIRFADVAACSAVFKYHVSPLLISGHCFDIVSLCKTLYPQMLHLNQVKMSIC